MTPRSENATNILTNCPANIPFIDEETRDTFATTPSDETAPLVNQTTIIKCPPINIEFIDLTYTVPVGRNDSKILLRSVSGLFQARQLTAILGASGAGKSTLLNVLAGYKTGHSNGSILVNGRPRDQKTFQKISRYIMQEDLLQPNLTAYESMKIAAHLKLGTTLPSKQKYAKIDEIMSLLRLQKAANTTTSHLSGGEKKRLSIALELVNDPPVIFLDEPTTGLDDVASSQCISLLKTLSEGGRTVICSIHTPSARLFSLFDHVYIMSAGYCVFAGIGSDIVPYLSTIGLHCPVHYNPADFMVEVASGEYGDYTEKMAMSMDNGRCYRWNKPLSSYKQFAPPDEKQAITEKIETNHLYEFSSSSWLQFNIILYRILLQMWRERAYILLKFIMYAFTGLMIGSMYFKMGGDGSKVLFNFGFCFVTNIVFLYIPMLPVLLHFPNEVQLLKREYFNRWYGLNPYFVANSVARIPLQFLFCALYISITYLMTDQPMEWSRGIKFAIICVYISVISESLGYAISAQLNIVNSIFVGPALSVPLMLLAVYGLGSGTKFIPSIIRIAMYSSFLRYGVEGLVMAIYGDNRKELPCPDETLYCELRFPDELLRQTGMENAQYWVDIIGLTITLCLFKIICYALLKRRLSTRPSRFALSFVGRFIKQHFTLSR